jgi:4-amino-4-deoxy-L-arabinose transferase-like glycosyltransferase
MYRVVRRWAGPAAGLLGAGIFALTPVTVSMFGHSMEDGALTMCLVLAADSCQRAMMEGRLRSLAWAGFWVGLGFQAKMLQAWIVLPALAAGYLATAPLPLRRRVRDLAIAGAVMLAVSLSWIALYTVTPAGDRPYVDGSTNNSAISLVFGYNGLERFGVSFPGSVPSMFGGGGHGGGVGPAGTGPTGAVQTGTGHTGAVHAGTGRMAAVLTELQRAGFGMRSGGGWGKLAGSEFGCDFAR